MTTGLRRSARLERPPQWCTSPDWRPYTTAIGQFLSACNDLQKTFSDPFATAMLRESARSDDVVALAPIHVWNSQPSLAVANSARSAKPFTGGGTARLRWHNKSWCCLVSCPLKPYRRSQSSNCPQH